MHRKRSALLCEPSTWRDLLRALLWLTSLALFTCFPTLVSAGPVRAEESKPTHAETTKSMSGQEAVELLNDSPWSRQLTVTRVVQGVGSGEYGEKEIFSRYYVRVLSAAPVRHAYSKVLETFEAGSSPDTARNRAIEAFNPGEFIVLAVAFRSNQPDIENEVLNVLRSQTVETMKNRAFLSTSRFPQLELAAYYPPSEPAVGAQFVFPRAVNGKEVISTGDSSFAFELDMPGRRYIPDLRVTFPISEELVGPASDPASTVRPLQQEFRILKGQGSESFDLSASRVAGVVNLFPQQAKAKVLHGSLYEFHRNDNLDARNFFDPIGESLPEFKRNQFGISLGAALGPQLKLFGSYDGLRINQGSTLLSNVPTPAMKAGDFSELLTLENPVQLTDPLTGEALAGNRIPLDRLHPVSRKLVDLIPAPNRAEDVRNFVNSQPSVTNNDTVNLRADLGFNSDSQLTLQFQTTGGDGIEVHPFPAFGGYEGIRSYEASTSLTHTLSDNSVGTVRLEFERTEEMERPKNERPAGLIDSLGIQGVGISDPDDEGYPVFDVSGYPVFGDERLPQHEVENRYSLESEVTFVRGSHVLSVSGDLRSRQLNDSRSNSVERGVFSFSGIYSGHAFADFLYGRADQATRAIGNSRQDLRSRGFEFGFVDEWRVHPKLSLRLGLRYEYSSPFRSTHSNVSVFRPLLFEPPTDGDLQEFPAATEAGGITVVASDWNDFSPQIGFAYRPFGSGKFVVRGSYGVFYESRPSWLYENYMGRNYPHFYEQSSQASTDSSGLDLSSPFNTTISTELGIRDISPRLRTPYTQNWDIRIQNQFSDDWNLEVSYRWRRSLKDTRIIPGNVPLPGPGAIQSRRPNKDFGQFAIVTGGGSSVFYEFQVDLRRRFAGGFTFDSSFEWRRRFDDSFEDEPSNPRNLKAEWGPSGFPSRRVNLNFIVDLPVGRGNRFEVPGALEPLLGNWRLSGIAQISSGEYFGVVLPGDHNNDGLSNDRPDRVASGVLPADEQSIDRYFDTSAFVVPGAFAFGNSGKSILVGPAYHGWDMSLIKDFPLVNDHRLEVRFAFFNAFNHANFDNPNNVLGTRTFGVISGARRAREIEVALKYSF